MRVAVTIAVHNESRYLRSLVAALRRQTRLPDEIIIVDDGSTDDTCEVARELMGGTPVLTCISQKRKGPAAARNLAWQQASSDICAFTDGDCLPADDWLERLVRPLENPSIGATAGTYKTLNTSSVLARFIGYEIEYKYLHVNGTVDVHGSYNLAVRRSLLLEIGGFNESYPYPSGEDWDLTYNIAQRYPILFVRDAVVGHHHPERLLPYLKGQVRRAVDRMRLYRDFPQKKKGDVYTPWYVKFQVMAGGVLFLIVLVFPLLGRSLGLLPVLPSALCVSILVIPEMAKGWFIVSRKNDMGAALLGLLIALLRPVAWWMGACWGMVTSPQYRRHHRFQGVGSS